MASAMTPLEIEPADVRGLIDCGEDFLLVDCRERDEHALVSLPEAILLPMSEVSSRHEELAAHRQRRIVVHCHHGGRSLQLATWLRQQGYQAQSMAGGIDRWALEIDPSLPRY